MQKMYNYKDTKNNKKKDEKSYESWWLKKW
jgi:hypothetical protein